MHLLHLRAALRRKKLARAARSLAVDEDHLGLAENVLRSAQLRGARELRRDEGRCHGNCLALTLRLLTQYEDVQQNEV